MPTVTQNREVASQGRYWPLGMDSFTVPDQLEPTAYHFGQNVTARGGIVQSRPGSAVLHCLPDGNRQGTTTFVPANGVAHQVSAVDGYVYVSVEPFAEWRVLPGIRFATHSRFVAFASCLKTTDYTDAGDIYALEHPYQVLIMQDGITRAAFWDGTESRHLNPVDSGTETVVPGYNETKIGLWMAFSGARLWVARGNKLFASDLGNPLKFTDSEYINELPFFPLSGECTGMVELPDRSGLLVFSDRSADFFKSSVQDRTLWSSTTDFYRTVINVGCIAPRSIVTQHGLIYWFSPIGLMSINEALRANLSSELIPLDQEMAVSKALIGPRLDGICCATFENYLLVSVPYCSPHNTHTWALDLATFEGGGRAWNGIWTGWRPVEWSTAIVGGRQRCFFLSADTDGHNRIWEAFLPDRRDNGCAITCSVQFRMDAVGSALRKRALRAEIDCGQVLGEVSCMAAVAGWRGTFDRVMTKEIVASTGRIRMDQNYGSGTADRPRMGGNRPQVRTLRTAEWTTPGTANLGQVESDGRNTDDTHFQLLVAWSGRMGVLAYRLFAQEDPDTRGAQCERDETGPRVLKDGAGASAPAEFPTASPFPSFSGSASASGVGLENLAESITVQATATSQISQADATRRAQCRASRQTALLQTNPDITDDISATLDDMTITVITPNVILYESGEVVLMESEEPAIYG